MRKYYMLYKKEFILGPACKLTEAILELLVPLVMARIVDVGVQNGDVPYILKMGGLMVLLGAAGLGFALRSGVIAPARGLGRWNKKRPEPTFGSGRITIRGST